MRPSLVDRRRAGDNESSRDGAPLTSGPKPVLVLRKAVQVLDAFTPATPTLTAREVQRRTGLPATTCLRLLQTLVGEGFLDRRGDRYRTGLATLRWSRTALAALDVVAAAQPVLDGLRDDTGESAYLYMRDGFQHVCVAVSGTAHAVIHILRIGQVLPLHAGSAGRVFLAFDPAVGDVVDRHDLPVFTSHTLVDREALQRAVEETRRVGYAVAFEERTIGAASLSAPVRDHTGALLAVIGVAAPSQRFDPMRVPDLVPHVARASRTLSHRLGYEAQHAGGLEDRE